MADNDPKKKPTQEEMDTLLALQVISGLLTVVGEATAASMRIFAVLERAHTEDRDITDEEMADAVGARNKAESAFREAVDRLERQRELGPETA
jgi:hypothetical protein